jgi:hypothetical protein
MKENAGLMRLLACFVAVVVCVWQEQGEYLFPQSIHRLVTRNIHHFEDCALAAADVRKPERSE